jgi:ribose 5-phosphate isomerase A
MDSNILNDCKKRAAERAAALVEGGQVVGLGTGSTAKFVIESLGGRVRDGLKITGVATSIATEQLAAEMGIPIVALNDVAEIDITIDGADEVDPNFDMIKGGGGALTREKLVALASRQRVIVVDETKLVETLGKSFKLPVEVLPIAWTHTSRSLNKLGCQSRLRYQGDEPLITDNGNYILDCDFGGIADPAGLEKTIRLLPGVVECGLFVGIADLLVIGRRNGVEERSRNQTAS